MRIFFQHALHADTRPSNGWPLEYLELCAEFEVDMRNSYTTGYWNGDFQELWHFLLSRKIKVPLVTIFHILEDVLKTALLKRPDSPENKEEPGRLPNDYFDSSSWNGGFPVEMIEAMLLSGLYSQSEKVWFCTTIAAFYAHVGGKTSRDIEDRMCEVIACSEALPLFISIISEGQLRRSLRMQTRIADLCCQKKLKAEISRADIAEQATNGLQKEECTSETSND